MILRAAEKGQDDRQSPYVAPNNRSSARPDASTGPAAGPSTWRWWVAKRLISLSIIAGVAGWIGACGVTERLFYIPTRGATAPPSWLNPHAEAFWIESADGTRLRAWFIPGGPVESSAQRPTVVHFHGNAGNMNHHIDFTAHLVPAGINLVLMDYRGYGESDGVARRRDELIQDAVSTLRAVAARDDVDPARLGVFGHSLGGAIAISAVAQLHAAEDDRTKRIAAMVLESPFASWRLIAANAVGGDPPMLPARWLATWLIPDGDRPIDAAPTLDLPVLIVHGDRDRIVPASHGIALAEAFPDATLTLLSGGDHNTLLDSHPETAQLVSSFFLKHLMRAQP